MFDEVANIFIDKIREELRKTYPSKGYNGQTKNGRGNKIVTGELYNNISYRVFEDDNGVADSIVVEMEDYYVWVNQGRRPGSFPPVNVIRQWVLDRPVNFRPINGKIPSLETKTYLIGRSIAEKGIYRTNFLNKARVAALDEAIEIMGDEYADKLEEILFERTRTITNAQGDTGVFQIDLIQ